MDRLKAFYEKIEKMEKDGKISALYVGDTCIWEAMRSKIISELIIQLGIEADSHETFNKVGLFEKLSKKLFSLLSLIFVPTFFSKEKGKILIVDHVRKHSSTGYRFSEYILPLLQEFPESQIDVITNTKPLPEFLNARSILRLFTQVILPSSFNQFYFGYFLGLCNLTFFSSKILLTQRKQVEELGHILQEHFGARPSTKVISRALIDFHFNYLIFKRIFKAFGYTKVYILVCYFRSYIVKAAKETGVDTVEVQHGILNRYHYGYNYAFSPRYYPDETYVWGSYWQELLEKQNLPDRYIQGRYQTFWLNYKKHNGRPKKRKILVLSGSTITSEIAKFLEGNLEALFKRGYEISIRLHPHESSLKYAHLFEKYTELTLDKLDLYESLAESKFVLALNSTAVLEAVAMGCMPVLLRLSGLCYVEDLLKRGALSLDIGDTDAVAKLENAVLPDISPIDLFGEPEKSPRNLKSGTSHKPIGGMPGNEGITTLGA